MALATNEDRTRFIVIRVDNESETADLGSVPVSKRSPFILAV